jgi:hypothetical protein
MLTWSWILQITIISIILIFLVHHLINFFKSVLTVPKFKDLVNIPKEKYKNIYDTISNDNLHNDMTIKDNDFSIGNTSKYRLEDLLPPDAKIPLNTGNNMKNELKNFIKKQLDGDSNIQY